MIYVWFCDESYINLNTYSFFCPSHLKLTPEKVFFPQYRIQIPCTPNPLPTHTKAHLWHLLGSHSLPIYRPISWWRIQTLCMFHIYHSSILWDSVVIGIVKHVTGTLSMPVNLSQIIEERNFCKRTILLTFVGKTFNKYGKKYIFIICTTLMNLGKFHHSTPIRHWIVTKCFLLYGWFLWSRSIPVMESRSQNPRPDHPRQRPRP